MTRAGLKGRCYLELKSVLLEVGYIEKWPKFAYLESKVPHLKFRVMRDRVYIHVTRSQLELKRARCKISNKGYLSLSIFVILCRNMVIRSWDITTIPKGLSETFFGGFQQTISCDCV